MCIFVPNQCIRMMAVGGYVSELSDTRRGLSPRPSRPERQSRDQLGIISCCMKINESRAVALVVVVVCGTKYPEAHERTTERVRNKEWEANGRCARIKTFLSFRATHLKSSADENIRTEREWNEMKNRTTASFIRYYFLDQVKEDIIGRACSTYADNGSLKVRDSDNWRTFVNTVMNLHEL